MLLHYESFLGVLNINGMANKESASKQKDDDKVENKKTQETEHVKRFKLAKSIGFGVIAIVLVYFAFYLIIDYSAKIAEEQSTGISHFVNF